MPDCGQPGLGVTLGLGEHIPERIIRSMKNTSTGKPEGQSEELSRTAGGSDRVQSQKASWVECPGDQVRSWVRKLKSRAKYAIQG